MKDSFPFIKIIRKHSLPVFGVAGTHVMRFLRELSRTGLSHLYIPSPTELSAGFAAVGYSRRHGIPSLCLLTPGPGFLIGSVAVREAFQKGTPVIFIVGQVATEHLGRGGKALHELPEQGDVGELIAGRVFRVTKPEEGDQVLARALKEATSPPPCPVIVEIPVDAMERFDTKCFRAREDVGEPIGEDDELSDDILDLIQSSPNPVLFAGYGCTTPPVADLLLSLSDKLRAPIFTSISGKGAIPEKNKQCAGVLVPRMGRELFPDSELLIALGTVLSFPSTFNRTVPLPKRCILVTLGEESVSYPKTDIIRVTMPVKAFIEKILASGIVRTSGLLEKTVSCRKRFSEDARRAFPGELDFIDALEEGIPPGTPLFTDPTLIAYWARYFLPVTYPGTIHYPWGTNSLGYALPAAVGASIGSKERAVVITGDGNLPYSLFDLSYINENDLPLTVILFNDGGYGVLRKWKGWKSTSPLGVDILSPSLSDVCRGFRIDYNRCRSPRELGRYLALRGGKGEGPLFIEVETDISPPWSIL